MISKKYGVMLQQKIQYMVLSCSCTFYCRLLRHQKGEKSRGSSVSSGTDMQMFKKQDCITFHMPISLQPGYYRDNEHQIEGSGTPILPLVRCLGLAKTLNSASECPTL